jgi:alanyl aminopeptidase
MLSLPWARPQHLLLVCGALALAAPAEARLAKSVVPTFQSIHLRADPDTTTYSGRVEIDLDVRKATGTLALHSDGPKLERVSLIQQGKAIALAQQPGPRGLLTLTARRPLAPGPARLEIQFSNAFNTQAVSLYRMVKDGHGYLFTQMEAEHARQAFPCFDEPDFKFPYQLTLEIPDETQALFNTPIEAETRKGGWKSIRFQKTPPMPSYLLALAAGPLEFTEIPGLRIPARVVTVKGQSQLTRLAVQSTPPILAALEEYFGMPYPYAKLDLIAVPEYWFGAMENPGAITYSDNILLLDEKTASPAQRKSLYRITSHELAHMWFGDLVTMAWWDDLWLNESFADWMGDKITEKLLPELRHQLGELQNVQDIMEADARPSTDAIRQPVEDGDQAMRTVGLAYNKGKAVLAMFERWIGEDNFRRGVNEYLKAHAWKNAEAADLWSSLGKVSGKDVTAAMAGYIEQQGHPLVSLEPLADGSVRLTQRRFLNLGVEAEPLRWQIPMALKVSDGKTVRIEQVLLHEPTTTVKHAGVTRLAWVMPNAEGRGYYRWSIPRDMLPALARGGEQAMSPAERIAFLGNLGALLAAGEVRGDAYLEVLAELAGDPEPLVAASVISGLENARSAFVADPLRDAFAAYVRRTLQPMAARFGLEKKPREAPAVSLLRPLLLAWLGRVGRDPAALALADRLAESFLRDPASVDPAVASTALQLHALRGDRALFDRYRKEFESAKSPPQRQRFLAALGHFEDPALEEEALRYALQGPLRPNELFSITFGIRLRSEAGGDRTLQWVMENHDFFKSKLPAAFMPGLVNVAAGCSAERLAKARAFFSEAAHQVSGTEKELSQVQEQVQDCAGLRQREGAAVAAYLQRNSGESGTRRSSGSSP